MRYGLAMVTLSALLVVGGCAELSFDARDSGPECSTGRASDRSECRVSDKSKSREKTHGKHKNRSNARLGDNARRGAGCERSGEPRRLKGETHLDAWLRTHANDKCKRAGSVGRRGSGGTSHLDAWLADNYPTGGESTGRSSGRTCADVTSYDYNWDNDMLCTRLDGTRFYTNYAGADAFLSN